MPAATHLVAPREWNRRQQMAVDRIELAMDELATVLLSCGNPDGAVTAAIGQIRAAVGPVLAGILSDN
jgi:hypothetical protein